MLIKFDRTIIFNNYVRYFYFIILIFISDYYSLITSKDLFIMRKIFYAAIMLCLFSGFAEAQTKIVAHRGHWKTQGSAQNSITALVKADSVGSFGSEFDVWMTKDGELVVNHDKVYKGYDMEQTNYNIIREISLDNGEKIPSLDEYLVKAKELPDLRLVLEMKSLSCPVREDEEVAKIIEAVKKHNLTDRTDFISFSINACIEYKRLSPDTKIYYLSGNLTPAKIKQMGLTGIDYSMGDLRKNPQWIKEAQDLGLEVNVWTVDNENDMKYFLDMGVDYITTNHPEELKELIRN